MVNCTLILTVSRYRAISYMYHWHKGGLIFKDISYEKFSNDLTNYLLLGVLKELEDCIRDLGELGCLYQTDGRDGVMAVRKFAVLVI